MWLIKIVFKDRRLSYCLVTRLSEHNLIIVLVFGVTMSLCLALQANDLQCSALIFTGRHTRKIAGIRLTKQWPII